jgi:hypothetical protein
MVLRKLRISLADSPFLHRNVLTIYAHEISLVGLSTIYGCNSERMCPVGV